MTSIEELKAKAEMFAKMCGKKIKAMHHCASDGTTFSAMHAAEEKAKEMGFSIGTMQGDAPRALAKGDYTISKWRNISSTDYHRLDGLIICIECREADWVTVVVFE